MYRLKQVLFITLFTIVTVTSKGQTEAHFTQNVFANMFYNPGYAGMGDAICATGLLRSQWVGFQDEEGNKVAPQTFLLTLDSPLPILKGGIGGFVFQDKLGFDQNTGLSVDYSYHKEIGLGKLGVGMQVKLFSKQRDFSKYKGSDKGDLAGLSAETNAMMFDLGFGFFYKVPNKYYIGFSVTNILESKSALPENSSFSFITDRTFYLQGGYNYKFPSNPDLELEPFTLVEYNGKNLQVNMGTLLHVKQKFWGGVGYRLQENISAMVGIKIQDIKIGYAYDIELKKYREGGSHEIMVGYCFKLNLDRGKRIYRNTRFL